MTEDIQMPNGDFLKNYPGVTRVEVISNDTGREFVRYECSTVQVSLQDDGRTIKVFLCSTSQTGTGEPQNPPVMPYNNLVHNKPK